jgi:hypothetical protein
VTAHTLPYRLPHKVAMMSSNKGQIDATKWNKLSGVADSPPSRIIVFPGVVLAIIVFQVAGAGGDFSVLRQNTVHVKKIDPTPFAFPIWRLVADFHEYRHV